MEDNNDQPFWKQFEDLKAQVSTDTFESFIAPAIEKMKLADQKQQAEINSNEYKAQLNYLRYLKRDFVHLLHLVMNFNSYISGKARSMTVFFNYEFADSLDAIENLVIDGHYNAASREIRYMLEAAVEYSVADASAFGKEIEEKIAVFKSQSRDSLRDIVDSIVISVFSDQDTLKLRERINSIYGDLCKFVHPSDYQVDSELRRKRKDNLPAQNRKSILRVNKALFQVLDVLVALFFNELKGSWPGDIFVQHLDELPKWKFHQGEFTKIYSSAFDCKAERKWRRGEA